MIATIAGIFAGVLMAYALLFAVCYGNKKRRARRRNADMLSALREFVRSEQPSWTEADD